VNRIVYEGPDEPDPAFEEFFAGTKRYTPRSRELLPHFPYTSDPILISETSMRYIRQRQKMEENEE